MGIGGGTGGGVCLLAAIARRFARPDTRRGWQGWGSGGTGGRAGDRRSWGARRAPGCPGRPGRAGVMDFRRDRGETGPCEPVRCGVNPRSGGHIREWEGLLHKCKRCLWYTFDPGLVSDWGHDFAWAYIASTLESLCETPRELLRCAPMCVSGGRASVIGESGKDRNVTTRRSSRGVAFVVAYRNSSVTARHRNWHGLPRISALIRLGSACEVGHPIPVPDAPPLAIGPASARSISSTVPCTAWMVR